MMTRSQIEAFLGTATPNLSRDDGQILRGVASFDEATESDVVFAQAPSHLRSAIQSKAGLILADAKLRHLKEERTAGAFADSDERILWVSDARLAFAQLAQRLEPSLEQSEIHRTAVIADGAVLGSRLRIGPGVVIEGDVHIGDGCCIQANVVIHAGTTLGSNVVVKAGAILGSAGFGFAKDSKTGEYVPSPQQGRLVIERDVAIGANATIDRGALGETRIGAGTKIDNQVHIAHNCTIGRQVVIAAQTGIAGSSIVGDGAVIAGQVGIADHVTVGEGVILGAKSGVPSNKNLQGRGEVFWGIPARPIQQYLRELGRLKQITKARE